MFGGNRGDTRIKKLLDTLELKYSINSDGDFKLVFEMENGRSQQVFINSNTDEIDDFEVREVWSVAYLSQGYLDIDTANTLLMENSQYKVGSWSLIDSENNTYLVTFSIKLAADCDPNSLLQSLTMVTAVADEMEKKLTGQDDL